MKKQDAAARRKAIAEPMIGAEDIEEIRRNGVTGSQDLISLTRSENGKVDCGIEERTCQIDTDVFGPVLRNLTRCIGESAEAAADIENLSAAAQDIVALEPLEESVAIELLDGVMEQHGVQIDQNLANADSISPNMRGVRMRRRGATFVT